MGSYTAKRITWICIINALVVVADLKKGKKRNFSKH